MGGECLIEGGRSKAYDSKTHILEAWESKCEASSGMIGRRPTG